MTLKIQETSNFFISIISIIVIANKVKSIYGSGRDVIDDCKKA